MKEITMLKTLISNITSSSISGTVLEEYGEDVLELVKGREKDIVESMMESVSIENIWRETKMRIRHEVETSILRETQDILYKTNRLKLQADTLEKLKRETDENPIKDDFLSTYKEVPYKVALSDMMKGNIMVCTLNGVNYRWRYNPNSYFIKAYGTPEVTEDHIVNGTWYIETSNF